MLKQIEGPIAEIEDGKDEWKKDSCDDIDPFRSRRKFFGQPRGHASPTLTKVQTESF